MYCAQWPTRVPCDVRLYWPRPPASATCYWPIACQPPCTSSHALASQAMSLRRPALPVPPHAARLAPLPLAASLRRRPWVARSRWPLRPHLCRPPRALAPSKPLASVLAPPPPCAPSSALAPSSSCGSPPLPPASASAPPPFVLLGDSMHSYRPLRAARLGAALRAARLAVRRLLNPAMAHIVMPLA